MKLNHYYIERDFNGYENELLAIVTPDEEEQFNEDMVNDGYELLTSIELPQGDYSGMPLNRLLGVV